LDDFDWHGGAITRATPVTPSYRSTQNVRRFLHAECGAGFKFDRPFMQWIRDGTPKTMGARSPTNGAGVRVTRGDGRRGADRRRDCPARELGGGV
jgi:hypothetical protein